MFFCRLRHPNIVLIMGVTFAPPGHRITKDGEGSSLSLRRRRELGFENAGEARTRNTCVLYHISFMCEALLSAKKTRGCVPLMCEAFAYSGRKHVAVYL